MPAIVGRDVHITPTFFIRAVHNEKRSFLPLNPKSSKAQESYDILLITKVSH